MWKRIKEIAEVMHVAYLALIASSWVATIYGYVVSWSREALAVTTIAALALSAWLAVRVRRANAAKAAAEKAAAEKAAAEKAPRERIGFDLADGASLDVEKLKMKNQDTAFKQRGDSQARVRDADIE